MVFVDGFYYVEFDVVIVDIGYGDVDVECVVFDFYFVI